jgi:hypothetical protein
MRSGRLWDGATLQELELLMLGQQRSARSRVLEEIVQRLEALASVQGRAAAGAVSSQIDNFLRNSDFDHSVLSYTGAGAGDEVAHWARGALAAQPVKDTGTTPLWNKTEGWIEVSTFGAGDDLSYNFPTRLVRPGHTYWFQARAKLAADALAPQAQLEVGLWDKTAGIDTWLRASLVGNATTAGPQLQKIGPGAAVTTYGYRVTASDGREALLVSAENTIVGAASLDASDYIRLDWTAVAGTVQYRVYRTTGPQKGLLAVLQSGATSYLDQGATLEADAPLPPAQTPEARVVIADFGQRLTKEWSLTRAGITVPAGYNLSATAATGQWLRIGVRNAATGALVALDKIGLSLTPGAWAANAQDRQTAGDIVITPVGDGGQVLPFDPDFAGPGFSLL